MKKLSADGHSSIKYDIFHSYQWLKKYSNSALGRTEAILMDFGFGAVLDHIRDQFGLFWLRATLVFILATLITLGGNIIIKQALIPIFYSIRSMAEGQDVLESVSPIFVSLVITILVGALGTWIGANAMLRYWFYPKVDKVMKEHVSTSKSIVEELIQDANARVEDRTGAE